MAALILGGMYVAKKYKDRREKRRSRREWYDLNYAELERETEARLAGHPGGKPDAAGGGNREGSQSSSRARSSSAERRTSPSPTRTASQSGTIGGSYKDWERQLQRQRSVQVDKAKRRRSSLMGTY